MVLGVTTILAIETFAALFEVQVAVTVVAVANSRLVVVT
jgi:hypothetical protein